MKLATRLRRSIPLAILVFVLGYSVVYACAWIQLYFQAHPYKVASEWIFENIPQGSVLAGPHWDDRLPISIPGKEAPRYFVMEGRDVELPFYERDTRDKLNIILRRASKADYIIFPTARISDSIPRVPEEFPYTTAFIQLLWAEKLGFTFEKSFKDRPTFLGFTFNDDLADESFSVYDHPKVVIFKNKERLSEEQMRERVLNPTRYEPLPNLDQLLLMDAGGWSSTATVYDPNPRRLAVTFGFLLILGVSSWILLGSSLRFLGDRGLGVSFLGGIVLSGGLTCALAALGILPFNASAGLFVVALLIVAAVVRFCSSRAVRERCVDAVSNHGAYVLLSLFGGAVVVVAMKSLFPSYFWGGGDFERFALSFFARNETIPPSAGWNPLPDAGSFYFGHLLAGWLVKIVGATGTFAYELCFVMLGGAIGGLVYTVVSTVVRRPIYAIVITLIALTPAVRGAHVLFNGYPGIESAQAQGDLDLSQQRLAAWLSENITGAPLVVEACDDGSAQKIALSVGLPTLKGEQAQSVCSLQDPEAAYKSMMAQGIVLLIVPGRDGEIPNGRQELVGKFSSRPELFNPIYSDGGSIVFAPAFSEYFPRAYNQVAEPE
jgi:hypothetical protein